MTSDKELLIASLLYRNAIFMDAVSALVNGKIPMKKYEYKSSKIFKQSEQSAQFKSIVLDEGSPFALAAIFSVASFRGFVHVFSSVTLCFQ